MVTAAAAALEEKNMDVGPPAAEPAAGWADIRRRTMDLKAEIDRWPCSSQIERPHVISSKTCISSEDNQYLKACNQRQRQPHENMSDSGRRLREGKID